MSGEGNTHKPSSKIESLQSDLFKNEEANERAIQLEQMSKRNKSQQRKNLK